MNAETRRLTPMFKDEDELASHITSRIELRERGVVAPLSNPNKPFGHNISSLIKKLINDSGLTQGQLAYRIGVSKSTLNDNIRKPESLTLGRFVSIATYCAKASSGNTEKEDVFERNLREILLMPMDARDERDAMRAATVRHVSRIAEMLSDAKLAALLDVALSLSENDAGPRGFDAPPSWPLREASTRLRDEVDQAKREAIAVKMKSLGK